MHFFYPHTHTKISILLMHFQDRWPSRWWWEVLYSFRIIGTTTLDFLSTTTWVSLFLIITPPLQQTSSLPNVLSLVLEQKKKEAVSILGTSPIPINIITLFLCIICPVWCPTIVFFSFFLFNNIVECNLFLKIFFADEVLALKQESTEVSTLVPLDTSFESLELLSTLSFGNVDP